MSIFTRTKPKWYVFTFPSEEEFKAMPDRKKKKMVRKMEWQNSIISLLGDPMILVSVKTTLGHSTWSLSFDQGVGILGEYSDKIGNYDNPKTITREDLCKEVARIEDQITRGTGHEITRRLRPPSKNGGGDSVMTLLVTFAITIYGIAQKISRS